MYSYTWISRSYVPERYCPGRHRPKMWQLFLGLFLMPTLVQTLTESQKADVRHVIETIRSCRHIPGLTLSVVSSDTVIWKTAFGLSDIENNKEVTTKTLFPIGSTTKAFTSTLLAMMMEKHRDRLNWDTPIVNILGKDFQLYNETLTQHISLRDLLSHRTGIPGYFVQLLAGFPEDVTRKELVRRLRYFEPTHQFRTTFQYNNYMYMLAGFVAEVLEGEEWERMNTNRLFTPLGMKSSRYVRDITDGADLAQAYTLQNSNWVKVGTATLHQVDVAAPAGAIISNADDMTHWLQFNLKGGWAPSGQHLISPEGLRETYAEQMAAPYPMSDRDLKRPMYPISDIHAAYDLGWMTNYYRGYKRVWHSGGITTYKSMVWLYPDVDIGIYVSANGPPGAGGTWGIILALYYLSDLLLGEQTWLNTTTLCAFPEPWVTALPEYRVELADHPIRESTEYVGNYRHPGYSDVIVTQDPNTNTLQLRMGRYLEAKLLYNRSSNIFYTKFVGELWYATERIPVKFTCSARECGINRLKIPLYSPYETAKRVTFIKYSTSSKCAALNSGSYSPTESHLPQYNLVLVLTVSLRALL